MTNAAAKYAGLVHHEPLLLPTWIDPNMWNIIVICTSIKTNLRTAKNKPFF